MCACVPAPSLAESYAGWRPQCDHAHRDWHYRRARSCRVPIDRDSPGVVSLRGMVRKWEGVLSRGDNCQMLTNPQGVLSLRQLSNAYKPSRSLSLRQLSQMLTNRPHETIPGGGLTGLPGGTVKQKERADNNNNGTPQGWRRAPHHPREAYVPKQLTLNTLILHELPHVSLVYSAQGWLQSPFGACRHEKKTLRSNPKWTQTSTGMTKNERTSHLLCPIAQAVATIALPHSLKQSFDTEGRTTPPGCQTLLQPSVDKQELSLSLSLSFSLSLSLPSAI